MPENNTPEQASVLPEESQAEKVISVENEEVPTKEEESPAVKIVDEVQDSSQVEAESQTKVEDAPKKSYASIVSSLVACTDPFS